MEKKMPHVILQLSKGVFDQGSLDGLFKNIHDVLVVALPTQLASCKSRAVEHSCYRIGDGGRARGFVHLTVKVLPGRSRDLLDKVSQDLLMLLAQSLDNQKQDGQEMSLSVEIEELSFYHKMLVNG